MESSICGGPDEMPARRRGGKRQREILRYGVATISRLLKIIGLFCKKALSKRRYSAKETYNFKEPTHRSQPIVGIEEEWRYGSGWREIR